MSDNGTLIFALLQALIEEWEATYSIEEVACDEGKVALMLEATSAKGSAPARVKLFYEKVFLRDMWDRDQRSEQEDPPAG